MEQTKYTNGNGWVAVYRDLLEKPIWIKSTPERKVILITLLLMANHKPNEWEWNGQKFKVMPGQFITSLEKISQKAGKGISVQNIRSALKYFEKVEFLTNQSTKDSRLITLVNWEVYQHPEKKPTKQPTDGQQRPNKGSTTNNNDNNDNNETSESEKKNRAHKIYLNIHKKIPKYLQEYVDDKMGRERVVKFSEELLQSDMFIELLMRDINRTREIAEKEIKDFLRSIELGRQYFGNLNDIRDHFRKLMMMKYKPFK
jgi:hypothetical protein